MPVAAAGGDDLRVSDRDVVQLVADDRVDVALQFPAERGKLDVALSQRPVGEQQFAHRRCITSTFSVRHRSDDRRCAGRFSKAHFSVFSQLCDAPEIPIMMRDSPPLTGRYSLPSSTTATIVDRPYRRPFLAVTYRLRVGVILWQRVTRRPSTHGGPAAPVVVRRAGSVFTRPAVTGGRRSSRANYQDSKAFTARSRPSTGWLGEGGAFAGRRSDRRPGPPRPVLQRRVRVRRKLLTRV